MTETQTYTAPRVSRLLEYNPSKAHPWLTVASAQEEIAIQASAEAMVFQPFEEFVREMHDPQPVSFS